MKIVGSLLLLLGALALLYREDWRGGAALTAFALLALVVLMAIRNFAVPFMAAEREASAGLYSLIEERLSALDDVRANGGAPHSMRRMHQAMGNLYRRDLRAAAAGTSAWMALMALFAVGYGLALGIGAWLFHAGAISLGVVYLSFQYTQMLRSPLEQLADQVNELQKAGAGIGRIGQLLARRSAIADAGATPLPAGALSVELDGLGFAYADEVKDLSSARPLPQPAPWRGDRRAGAHRQRQDDPDPPDLPALRAVGRGDPPGRGGSARHAPGRAAPAGRHRHPGRAALPGQPARQPEPLRP